MLEKWKSTLDIEKVLDVFLLNLSNAFDTINHDLLMTILKVHGICRTSLSCMFS